MLCVTITIVDAPAGLAIKSSTLPVAIGSNARQGSSISSTSGSVGRLPRCTAVAAARRESSRRTRRSRSFTSSHKPIARRLCSPSLLEHAAIAHAVDPQPIDHVLEDAHWETRSTFERPCPFASAAHHVDRRPVDRIALQPHIPRLRTEPIRSFMRLTQRSKVDLPQPDGPMSAVTRALGDVHPDIEQCLLVGIPQIKLIDVEHEALPARRERGFRHAFAAGDRRRGGRTPRGCGSARGRSERRRQSAAARFVGSRSGELESGGLLTMRTAVV